MTEEIDKLRKRNHSLRMQSKNLLRQIKSMTEWNRRLQKDLLKVSMCNCEGPTREAETYKEILFRSLTRLAGDEKQQGVAGRVLPEYVDPEIMAKAKELRRAMFEKSKVKCRYDDGRRL